MEDWEKFDRMYTLLKEIHSQRDNKTLIFTGTKRLAGEISSTLRRQGWGAGAIHGDKKQEEREYVLGRKCCVLECYTTVVAVTCVWEC